MQAVVSDMGSKICCEISGSRGLLGFGGCQGSENGGGEMEPEKGSADPENGGERNACGDEANDRGVRASGNESGGEMSGSETRDCGDVAICCGRSGDEENGSGRWECEERCGKPGRMAQRRAPLVQRAISSTKMRGDLKNVPGNGKMKTKEREEAPGDFLSGHS